MAEKKSNAKNEKPNSTLEATSEKTTKTTAKKADSKPAKTEATATKTTAKPAEKSAKASTDKAATSKTSTQKAASASSKSGEKSTAKTASKTNEKVATEKAVSKTNTKANAEKSVDKTKPKASAEKAVSSKTTESKADSAKVSEKASKNADKTSTPKAAVKKETAKPKAETTAKAKPAEKKNDDAKAKQSTAEKEVVATKAPSNKAKKADVKSQETATNNDAITTGVYGTTMAASRAKSKKAEEVVANEKPNTTPKQAKTNASQPKKTSLNAESKAKSDRMVASKAAKDKNAKFDIKNFAKDSAVAVKGIFTNKKTRVYGIVAIAAILLFILILSISLGAVANNTSGLSADSRVSSVKDYSLEKGSKYDYEYRTTAVVGYQEEYLEYNEPRKIPTEIKNEGIVQNQNMYPKYGYTPKGITEQDRKELIQEAWQLSSINTRIGSDGYPKGTFNKMDKDGNLYLNGVKKDGSQGHPSKLYKHTCADGMYFGNVSDDEKPISKKMTFNPRSFHSHGMYSVTGIYAPAGEVLKVEISEEDMESTGGIIIYIGQALYNSKANNIWLQKGQMQRFPIILNTMYITKDTAEHDTENHKYVGYVGSFVGGPVYVGNEAKTFTTTISGGVRYSHFILGHTTPEDFEANKDSSAPYFDLEVWDNGVLHSGPKRQAVNFSYNDLFKVAELWDKITSVTTTGNNQNIVFLYDPFVAAGAAVAFPSQHAVNCPEGWMKNSLNYETLIKSGGWGNLHEYHHNFQGFGVGNGGEVTNNALTLVSYALFTKISANRRLDSIGAGGLGGWNSYTSATWALDQVKAIADPTRNPSNGNQGLALYATLLHNFGADAFIQVRKLGGGQSYQNYFNKWEQFTHNNMSYYFNEMLKSPTKLVSSYPDSPIFVPVSSVYQTGRSWIFDNETKYFKTMQPYVIAYGEKFTIDLRKYEDYPSDYENVDLRGKYKCGSIVLPEGFSYKVLNVSQPQNGSITKESDYIYTYSPSPDLQSGDIYVTLQITHDDYKVNNIDLVLGFEQSHELTGRMLERTTYEFDEAKYTTTIDAWDKSYAGATNITTGNNKNSVENSNTDIWLKPEERASYSSKNAILEVKGKFYIDESAKYRFMLRGRGDVALYLSFDQGKNYEYAARYLNLKGTSPSWPVKKVGSDSWVPINEDVYEDYVLEHSTNDAYNWVYFKMVLIVNSHNNSFMGLGIGKVPDLRPDIDPETGLPLYDKVLDEFGNPIIDPDTGEALERPRDPIQDPTPINYASAYRQTYQFVENKFAPDYFYSKTYNWSYQSEEQIQSKQTLVGEAKYKPWDNTPTHQIGNLFDDDDKTFIHTNREAVSEANPFEITVQLDKPVTANTLTFYGSDVKSQYRSYLPRNLKIWVSNDGKEWTLVADVVNSTTKGITVPVEFDQTYTFKYYRTEITDTHVQTKYLALNKIELSNLVRFAGGTRTAVGDKKVKLYGSWNITNTSSKFGRVYVGKQNSTMEFEFTGKMLILYSSFNFGTNFEVYIDGKKVNSIDFIQNPDVCRESYISSELKNKTHNVVIKCLGEANIESIVVVK